MAGVQPGRARRAVEIGKGEIGDFESDGPAVLRQTRAFNGEITIPESSESP